MRRAGGRVQEALEQLLGLVGPENDAASTVHSSSAQGGDEDGLDGVEPVLGLVEDDAGG